MTPETRSEIIDILERSRREFHDAARPFIETDATTKPDPERWCALECVEHVAVVEKRFLSWFDGAERTGAPPVDQEKESRLSAGVRNREQRAQSPEAARPTGRFATFAEALAAFEAARDESVRFAEAHAVDLYNFSLKHPRFGAVNGHELMLIIAGHSDRHAAQIREIRAALNPSSQAG